MKQEISKLVVSEKIAELEEYLKKSTLKEINEKEKGLLYSLLTLAVVQVRLDAIKLLLKYGADPNSLDRYGRPPLYYAGEEQSQLKHDTPKKHLEIAELLLDNGAEINITDIHGNQPLWTAVFYTRGKEENLPLVKFLVEKGADPKHKNNAGNSPLDFAKKVGYQPLIDILEKKI